MTTNVFDDNLALWAASLNAMANADVGEAIVSGCSVSKGSGDWDSDITSGTVRIGGAPASVSSDTVTHSDSSGLASGESRVDLITADSSGALSITEGTGADDPASPDIPTDEVVVGFWVIANGDATLAASDLFDVPALFTDPNDPIYGDGSDGSITRSSNANENGLLQATDYTVESGTTLAVTTGILFICAQDSVTIDGTIDASGQGAAGGTSSGQNGSNGTYTPDGTGGAGGGGGGPATNGGNGGDGRTAGVTPDQLEEFRFPSKTLDWIQDIRDVVLAGAGGGAGGDGVDASGSNTDGEGGTAPGGGGGGAEKTGGGLNTGHGDGGDGGGMVIILSPSITGSGTIDCSGEDGVDSAGIGGGGGGGTGGVIALLSTNDISSTSITRDVSKGTGGSAGNTDAGVGADGADGVEVTL